MSDDDIPEDLKDKTVIDTSGTIVGKCIGVKEDENGDEEPSLIVEVNTEENGIIETKIPISTIQAVGETIVLSVEIEGLIKDKTIIPMKKETIEKKEKTEGEETESEIEQTEEKTEEMKSKKWKIYKSIRA